MTDKEKFILQKSEKQYMDLYMFLTNLQKYCIRNMDNLDKMDFDTLRDWHKTRDVYKNICDMISDYKTENAHKYEQTYEESEEQWGNLWCDAIANHKRCKDMTEEQYELLTKRDDKRTVTEVELAERLANIRSFCLQQCEGIKSSMVPGYYLDPSAMIDKYKHILDMIDKPL